ELELGRIEERLDALRRVLHRRRTDRLVRVLRLLARAVDRRLLRQVLLAVAGLDELARVRLRLGRDAGRVGAHVGDETDRALAAELDALVELLRDAHRPLRAERQLARRLLLQTRRDERRLRVALALL